METCTSRTLRHETTMDTWIRIFGCPLAASPPGSTPKPHNTRRAALYDTDTHVAKLKFVRVEEEIGGRFVGATESRLFSVLIFFVWIRLCADGSVVFRPQMTRQPSGCTRKPFRTQTLKRILLLPLGCGSVSFKLQTIFFFWGTQTAAATSDSHPISRSRLLVSRRIPYAGTPGAIMSLLSLSLSAKTTKFTNSYSSTGPSVVPVE